jgi:hypothetical protein
MAISKSLFETIPIGQDLSLIKDNPTSFYNILYSPIEALTDGTLNRAVKLICSE